MSCVPPRRLSKSTPLTIEETLALIERKAALLQHLADSASVNKAIAPSAAALGGLADACQEIEERVRAVRRRLPADARELEMASA